jgi:hypothetical protein
MPSARKAGLPGAVAPKVDPREVAVKGGLVALAVAPVKAAEVPAARVGT